MNRTYSIVWSAVRNMYVVASELARSHSKVKIQAHANEVAPSIKKPDSGWARHHALALAIVAALGFASPLAIADNPVSYIDGVDHDLSADSPISYSGTGEGSALHLEGLPTQGQGWQPTSATGTNIEIGTDGGGAPLSSGSDAVATAVSLYRGATLELTDAKIYTKGNYTAGISLDEQSKIRLNGGNLEVEGNYGILMLYNNSQATLIGTEVTATAETTSSIVSQQGSTLNITDGSDITLTSGQLRVVGDTNGSAFLNVSDSTVSSTGANSTVVAANRGILDIKNSSVTHNNATGAAIEASSASTLNVFGDDKSQMSVNSKGVGVKGIASSVEINGATITADDDGILMTSQGKSSWYDDTNALTVNNADVTSKTAAALHVDSKTNINDPIELNNSTLTGPTAIKLESAVTVQATNSTTLDGNVDAGITASSLSLTNSSLQGSVNGVHSSLTLDADSQWTMTGSSALGSLTSNGEITLGDGSASAKTLQITNALTLQNDSQLNITLSATDSPVITTGSATLDGSLTLNLDSTAAFGDPTSDQQFKSITLIDSDNAISTNVDSLTTNIDTDSLPDYLTFGVDVDANDNTNFVLEQQLSWNANATSISEASGTFTLGDNETFEVTSELSKVSPVPGGWDGETLTKEGDGTLILSNTANDYGNTNINGGTLSANDAAALGSGDVVIAENATLALSQGTLDNNVTGEGQIVKSGSDELIVTGDNSYSGGTTITGGTLIADNADLLGTGAIANSGVLQVGEGELENTLSGSGSLVKTGSGELTLSGDNDYSGGTIISDGTLIADNADSLGTGAVANSGVLQVGEGELENTLSGSGSLVKTGSGELTLSGDNDYSGGTIISDGTLIAANVNALGGGDVDNAGTLKLDAEGEFNLANVTTQSGATTELAKGTTLNVDSLTQQADSTLNIDLSEANGESAITADSVTLGGTLNISGIGNVTDSWTPEAYTYTLIDSDSAITTDFNDLTVAGMNSEDVDFLTIDGKVDEADNTNYDLTASLSWYADRDNASTDAHGTFTLSDPDGNFNVAATLTDVDDTLDPGSTWDGKSLTKEGAGTLILSGDNDYSGGTTINEGTLVAASTTALGTGLVDNNATLVLDADSEVSAAGGITTHSGATTQLALGTSLDLGDSALIQEDGSTLNVELNSDLVQPLITGGSATLGGDLVVSDASLQARASDAEFQSFKLMDMDSDISGDFTSLTMNLTDKPDYLTVTGAINPQDQSEYLLTEGLSWNATATSATPAHGTFTLGADDSFEVTSVLGDKTGNGDWDGKTLTKLGAGKLMLSGANTYTGDTNVQEGTLWLSGDGTIGEMGSQQAVNVASGATFGGSNGTTVNGKVTNEGMLVFGDSDETGAIFTLNGDLINMGTMTSGSSASTPGNTLYVDGNYTGNGGSLYLNTVLGDDDSATDKLVITGDASGTTELYINGIGDGAQTTNGIEVVDVGGVSTSDAFVLKNEVNASLYTYRLYWNESDNDWYLASKAQSDDDDSGGDVTPSDGGDDGGDVTPSDGGDDGGDVTPSDGGDDGGDVTPSDGGDDGGDVTPSDGGDDGGDVTPSDDGGDGGDVTPPDDGGDGGDVTPPNGGGDVAPQYRADIGAYMGNQWMARNLQMQTLYDREGSQYRNADGSVWARFKAGKAESEAVSGNIDMDSNYSQFQLGGDILAWGNGQQSITVGVMASYINADTDSTGNRGADGSQFTSSANVDGYNLGIYATWFADAKTHSGAYVDSWYQYGFYNNSVESGDAGSESYDSTANAVSLETGYRYDIALNNGNTVSLTPQAQVVWQNYSADSVKDNYGTRIDGQDGDSWTTRLGLRVDGKLYKGSRTVIQPFAEANWLHTSDDVSVSFDDATVKQDLPANRAELKVGLQADIDKQWSVRAQVAGQTGSNDFGDLNGSLNLRYNW
ncbi:autotransporter outer membrane beta-barrel domain-containing protein [Salmonella enterica]|uniref:autotransporter outer membrane beta-barrel domain-containing protein n=1 Tax=Salmonella enterica TaxID=28901 RepID=UPI001273B34A|nr:autotransporter outer membrane beta-barrel domain-containing protein [Salmonella enterica]EAO3885476.1 autotransporter outer membrane beta-barrel domain-containing protein [Salmonella enterica]EAO4521733.1 autotransporter outer membrane beta-barrel domain-containing protein [Salmonella enterica]EAP2850401.1 autotransporter outer membrane beta-barrel domain-containing protein [Salmonella enterica]EAP4364638.1 autotransporter outer membrane beta-barrel domain-containing protein [Salmonella ent